MSVLFGSSVLAKEICDALGLKNVKKLDLHFSVDAVATAEVEFYPDSDDLKKLPAIAKRYVLTEQKKL
jgi:hypothetical protein